MKQGSLQDASVLPGFYQISSGLDFDRFPLWFPMDVVRLNRKQGYILRNAKGGVAVDKISEVNASSPGLFFGIGHEIGEPQSKTAFFILRAPSTRPKIYSHESQWQDALRDSGINDLSLVSPESIQAAFAKGRVPACSPKAARQPADSYE
jgi:hypothetical protein